MEPRPSTRLWNSLRGLALTYFTLVLLCMLLSQPASAGSVYDSWVLVGKTVTVADQEIHPKSAVGDDWEQLLLDTGEGNFIISKGDCRNGKYYQYCYAESRYELGVYGEWDYVTRTATPEVHLIVNDISPLLTITAAIDKSSLAVNDLATVTVKVKNAGSLPAQTLSYTAELPEGTVPVTGNYGASFSGRTVTWKTASLAGGAQEKQFSYTFKVTKDEAISFAGNLTYEYEGNSYSKSHSTITATVIETVKVSTFSLSKASASINEQVTLTANITNADQDYEARIKSFTLTAPAGLEIVKKDTTLFGSGRTLSWDGTIQKNGSKSFEVVVRTLKKGSYKFLGAMDAEVFSASTNTWLKQNSSHEQTLTVSLAALSPSIEFVLGKNSVDGGEQTGYRVFLSNPDAKASYFDIEYTITSELNDPESKTLKFLAPGKKNLMFSNYFNAPIMAESKAYTINFSGKYRTENYEQFTFGTVATLTVSKEVFEQLINLTQMLPGNVSKGGSAEVVVNVRNLQENDIKLLKLTDTVTGAEITSGSPSITINLLQPNTEIEAYRYTISVPADSEKSAVVIKTKAEFDYKDGTMRHYTQYAEGSAAITGTEPGPEPEPEPTVPTEEPGTPEVPGGAPAFPAKEEGFFTKLINSIKQFLQGIF